MKSQPPLKIISIQSDNAAPICRQIALYLGEQLDLPTEFVNDIPWKARECMLDSGQAHVGWICGLPYIRKVDGRVPCVELVAAPVMKHPRYQARPIYFSDVVVRSDRTYRTFADLRGASWAYNERGSQSGYNITRYHLARLGERVGYFGTVVEAGSHLRALEMVLAGTIDAAAIDSTVLETELELRAQLRKQLRVLEILGPSPMPPWVVATTVPSELRDAIREVFWHIHDTATGRDILEQGRMLDMVRVRDRDYDVIRDMERAARRVIW